LAVQWDDPGRRDGDSGGTSGARLPVVGPVAPYGATRLRRAALALTIYSNSSDRLQKTPDKVALEALDAMGSQPSARLPLARREGIYATDIVLVAHARTLSASTPETGSLTSRQGEST
jgi:hypothetical protein